MAKGKNKNNKNKGKKNLPFVSVCTPTFNRRPFIKSMIKCFDHQKYPKDRMEWIIIDDGTDPIEDLVATHPNVKYFKFTEKMSLGKKRNMMHEKSKGDIIVYMDDDDYYPPERVSHAVEMLVSHPKALCAGTSEIYIYFHEERKVYQFGPYSPNHATAGTFAFKRELLNDHCYDNEAALAEEKAFLKNYTVPFVQLEPKKVILVFSHEHNTFDKRKLLKNPNDFIKVSDKTVDDFVKQCDLKDFYMAEIHELIKDYEPGKPEMKPDVIKQTKEIEERRARDNEGNGKIMVQDGSGNNKELSTKEIVEIIKGLQEENAELKRRHGGNIVMETPEGNRALSTEEVASLIKQLQHENISLKEQIKNNSIIQTTDDIQTLDDNNKQLIITDEDDCMEILDFCDMNDYINKKIAKIKELKNEQVELIQKAGSFTSSPKIEESNEVNENFQDMLNAMKTELKNEIKEDMKHLLDGHTSLNHIYMERDGKNVKLDQGEVYEIIQQQQKLIELCKKELEEKKILFNDGSGEEIELNQEIFNYIIQKYQSMTKTSSSEDVVETNNDDSVDIDIISDDEDDDKNNDNNDHNNDDNDDDSDDDSDDDNDVIEESPKFAELAETLKNSHGNNASNIKFKKS